MLLSFFCFKRRALACVTFETKSNQKSWGCSMRYH